MPDSRVVSILLEMSMSNLDPISFSWLRQIGFEQNRPCHVHGTEYSNWWNDEHEIELWESHTGQFHWIEYDSVTMTKKGELLNLIQWASVRCGSRQSVDTEHRDMPIVEIKDQQSISSMLASFPRDERCHLLIGSKWIVSEISDSKIKLTCT